MHLAQTLALIWRNFQEFLQFFTIMAIFDKAAELGKRSDHVIIGENFKWVAKGVASNPRDFNNYAVHHPILNINLHAA